MFSNNPLIECATVIRFGWGLINRITLDIGYREYEDVRPERVKSETKRIPGNACRSRVGI